MNRKSRFSRFSVRRPVNGLRVNGLKSKVNGNGARSKVNGNGVRSKVNGNGARSKVNGFRHVKNTVLSDCPYQVDEKVLCFEPDPMKCKVLYEAKILKITSSEDSSGNTEFQYLVHFQGWNSSWDRFVAEDLIMKDNDESRKLQAELNELAAANPKKGKQKRVKALDGGSGPFVKRQKVVPLRKAPLTHRGGVHFIQFEEEGSEVEDDDEEDFNLQITLPEPFSKLLEVDYFAIHDQKRLPLLPAPMSVAEILERFVKFTSFQKLERWYKKFEWGLIASRTAINAAAHTSTVTPPPCTVDVKTPDELLKALNEVEVTKQLAMDTALMFDCYVDSILLYNGEKGRYETCLRNKAKFKESSKIDLPEGLRFQESDEKAEMQTVTSAVLNDLEATNGAVDADDILLKNHCAQKISKFAKELVNWSLADWGLENYARPSLIYGLPHLLRLLVKTPDILVKSDLQKSRLFHVSIFVNRLLSYVLTEFKEEHMHYEKAEMTNGLQAS